MEELTVIGIDLAKRSFQLHGAKADGSVAYRTKLSRGRLLGFLAAHPKCTVAMEACAGAHYWGRQIVALGHEVRLVPPIYVKPFVKRTPLCGLQHNGVRANSQRDGIRKTSKKRRASEPVVPIWI